MKKTLIVNLYGGPGIGKTTAASYLFTSLKQKGYDIEFAAEYAKDKVWERNYVALEDPLYILGNQHHRLFILKEQVNIVVTDSPILLGLVYINSGHIYENMEKCIIDHYRQFWNLNIILDRETEYQQNGRIEDEKESTQIDKEIGDLLGRIAPGESYRGKCKTQEDLDLLVSLVKLTWEDGQR